MTVVSDTSPINYLVLIDAIDILEALYAEVTIPLAVQRELSSDKTPASVRQWVANAPVWLRVEEEARGLDAELLSLGRGEREAIALVERSAPSMLIIDEVKGRMIAKRRGVRMIGTLGVLRVAAARSLLDFRVAVTRLQTTGFYVSEDLVRELLDTLPSISPS